MSESDKKQIIGFCTPPISVTITGAVFALISPLGFFVSRAVSSDEILPYAVLGSMILMGFICLFIPLYYRAASGNAIKHATETAGDVFLVQDFRNGKRFLNERVICGKHYIIGKGAGVIVRLADIDQIWREAEMYKFVQTGEKLVAKMKDNKRITLYSISSIETVHASFADIIREIQKNAPDIEYTDKRY